MNIATICYPTAGGSGVVATELAIAMAERGHQIHLVAAEKPIRLKEEQERLEFHRVNVPRYDLFPDASYGMAAACTLRNVLEEKEIDLVHAHYAFPHALSAYLAGDVVEKPNVPIMTTLHGTDIFLGEDQPCHYEIVRSSLDRSTSITAVSAFLKEEAQRIFGSLEEINIIPNFVDIDEFQPFSEDQREKAKSSYCSEESCLLAHVSNYRSIKRSENMVRLLRHMRESGQQAHLLMIGDGPERERVKGMIGEFHMREHATWLDPVEDIQSYLAAADFLVVTSERESFSMSALEAMSCGVPVLNFAVGGIRELVRGGTEGFHFGEGELMEGAEQVAEQFQNRKKLEEMRRAARQRVEENFSKQLVVPKYEDLYEETRRPPDA